jgi:hypothetical protein
MEMRQAHFRNMRSKCRCSCVLQFTRHHGVSSVLHRPPSQMIHCIVLCFGFSDLRPEIVCERRAKQSLAAHPNVGEITNPGRGGCSLNRLGHPTTPTTRARERGTVPRQSRAVLTQAADSKIGPSSGDVASFSRRAETPRSGAVRPKSRGGLVELHP